MVAHTVVTSLYTVPFNVLLAVDDGDVHQRFFGLEEALHVVSLRFWLQRDVEDTLSPAFVGPSLRLSEVVDCPPVSQSDNLVEVHFEEILSHGGYGSLALVELHPRETASVAREIHITVVVRLHICLHGEVGRQRIGVPIAVAWMHGHGDQTGGIVSLYERPHELIHGDAEVVERLIGVLLQLVAEAPQHDGR